MELLPCKKCGYAPGRRITYGHFFGRKSTYRISCPSCSYCTKEKQTKQEAEEAWNRRAEPNMVEIDQFSRVGEGEKE